MKQEATTHSEQQAAAQCESIAEMVRALNIETAAEDHAATMTPDEIKAVLAENEIKPAGDSTEELREQIAQLLADEAVEVDGFEFDEEAARERIQEDPLSVEVRSDWHSPGDEDGNHAAEFCILLCTGGPTVRIVGELDRGEPSRAWVEHQDWGTSWTHAASGIEHDTLLTYCRQFYYGDE